MKKDKLTRQRIFEIIQIGRLNDFSSRFFDLIVVACVIINIAVSICYTFDTLRAYDRLFSIIDAVTVIFFTVELGLRLWTADFLFGRRRSVSAIKYLLSFSGLVELLSIVPFYLPFIIPKGAIAFRMFRVVRILRLFQAGVYSDALSTIMIVLKRKRSQIMSSMFIIFIIMVMSSLVMYGFEHEAQPEVFSNAFSGIWWSTSTLLTVGYGDIYPVTMMGKIASIIITFLGVGMVAIPTGILSAGFTQFISEQKAYGDEGKAVAYCPYCGEKLPK